MLKKKTRPKKYKPERILIPFVDQVFWPWHESLTHSEWRYNLPVEFSASLVIKFLRGKKNSENHRAIFPGESRKLIK